MTKREQFDKAIQTLEKMKNGQRIDVEDFKLDDIIELLKNSMPRAYASRKKTTCVCGAKPRDIWLWFGTKGYICRCTICELEGEWSKTERKAIEAWNQKIASKTEVLLES